MITIPFLTWHEACWLAASDLREKAVRIVGEGVSTSTILRSPEVETDDKIWVASRVGPVYSAMPLNIRLRWMAKVLGAVLDVVWKDAKVPEVVEAFYTVERLSQSKDIGVTDRERAQDIHYALMKLLKDADQEVRALYRRGVESGRMLRIRQSLYACFTQALDAAGWESSETWNAPMFGASRCFAFVKSPPGDWASFDASRASFEKEVVVQSAIEVLEEAGL